MTTVNEWGNESLVMEKPLVSVVMPARNAAPWIAAAIESVLGGTYKNVELLIANDGSFDDTRSIAKSFQDERVRVMETGGVGPSEARNSLIAWARGKYLAFQDADDICGSTRLEKQVDFLSANPSFVGVSCSSVFITTELQMPQSPSKVRLRPATVSLDYGRRFHAAMGSYSFPASMVRTEVARRIGGLRPYFDGNEDVDFNFRLAEEGPLGNLTEVLYGYRRHAQNTIRRSPYKSIESSVLARLFAARRARGEADNLRDKRPNFVRLFTSGLSPVEIGFCGYRIVRRMISAQFKRR